jgi:UDP-2,3-diacylglucosamine pyrophosphatase LpxH
MPCHNLLVLSDVHLGSDLVQHARPYAPARGAASRRRDRELVALLDWYRARPRGGLPWRLVIAGDLVDFTGMSVSGAPDEIVTELNDEELRHGLGSSVDHTLAKLRRVAEHHRPVFAALARFVDAGNTLVVVRGNHDVDLHWEPVKDAFRAILARYTSRSNSSVEFSDWFYYEEGLVYIEHGHQYDDYCSYDYLLHPVRPSDPHRSDRSLSDVLLRYVVRPTRGMLESGHDAASALDYLRFAGRLGTLGLLALGRRFVSAIAVLVALWREHFGDATRWVRHEHERRMALLAEALQISLIRLQALASLQRPPVTRSLVRIFAGVMLDRVAGAVVASIAVIWLIVARWTPALGLQLAAAAALGVPLAWIWRRARRAIDASDSLRERAARVATLFPAAFVVMGHTHLPEVAESADGTATYVNVGAWAEEETPDDSPGFPASRTHLVVEYVEGRARGLLLRWTEEQRPEHFVRAPGDTGDSGVAQMPEPLL